jgi:hypothetical protein
MRRAVLVVALAVSCVQQLPAASAQTKKEGQAAKPAGIDHNGILILIRSTLLALDHANRTGDYSVLRQLGAPDFQANNPARLAEIFARQRREGLDLSGVAVLEPQLTLEPQIEPDGTLHLAGFFPSAAMQLDFELAFAPVDRQWKISGMSVKFGPSVPGAPDSPPAPRPKLPTEKPKAPSAAITTKAKGAADKDGQK